MKVAKFYKNLEDDLVKCNLCHHFCMIPASGSGFCGARKNINGKLYSLVYGYPAAMNVDPVEKKPFVKFMPGTFTYSLGTLGCNFRCPNCHNYSISQEREIQNMAKRMIYISPQEVIRRAISSDCESISYTYNEPTIFAEYAFDIMRLARKKDLKNILVTNGYMSDEYLKVFVSLLDAANIDIKAGKKSFHKKLFGTDLDVVLKNTKRLKFAGVHIEITTLMVPGLDEEQIEFIADFIADELSVDTPWHVSRFSPTMSWKQQNEEATSRKRLDRAYEIGKKAGLKNIYLGNV